MKKRATILYNIHTNKGYRYGSRADAAIACNVTGAKVGNVCNLKDKHLLVDDTYTAFYADDYTVDNVQERIAKIKESYPNLLD